MSIGVVFISIFLYPILERHNKNIAVTYVGFRITECLLLTVGAIVYFILINLGHEFVKEGKPDWTYYQTIATLAIEARYPKFFPVFTCKSIVCGIGFHFFIMRPKCIIYRNNFFAVYFRVIVLQCEYGDMDEVVLL